VLAPLLLIRAVAYGIDPIPLRYPDGHQLRNWFLTPPMGLNLIVAMTAFKESFGTIVRSVLPFVFLIFSVLLIVTFVPWTALALTG